jgi:hypothetical protein
MLERYRTLAAILALQRFTVADLARFSGVKESTVRTVLKRDDHYVEILGFRASSGPGGRFIEYRLRPKKESELVRQLQELEQVGAVVNATNESPQRHRDDTSNGVHLDLIAAEDILLFQFPSTQDADDRQRLLKLARLHFADGFQPPKYDNSDETITTASTGPQTENQAHSQAADILLRLSEAEDDAQRLPAEAFASLTDLRRDWHNFLANLPRLQDKQLLPSLFDRIIQSSIGHLLATERDHDAEEFPHTATSPVGTSASLAPIPRLLSELSWRRRWAAQYRKRQVSRTARVQAPKKPWERSAGPAFQEFYTVLERLTSERDRLLVYSDLLALTPTQYAYNIARTVLPRVMVELIADHTTSNHLEKVAATLEDDLAKSPFSSDAALIGQTAHSLHQMALDYSYLDDSIMSRADVIRKDLLELEGLRLATLNASS